MIDRRQFLKKLGAAALTGAGSSTAWLSCAGGLASYRGQLQDGAIKIPKQDALALQKSNGILVVRAKGLGGPIVLRNFQNRKVVATSMICTHRGCEVRPMPDSFECPCHGSAYDEFGEVLQGPARLPLPRFKVEETSDAMIVRVS
jgi:Rieske Fe-S protein